MLTNCLVSHLVLIPADAAYLHSQTGHIPDASRSRPHHIAPFFFFNDTAPPDIYPLPLHDALPIFFGCGCKDGLWQAVRFAQTRRQRDATDFSRGPIILPTGARDVTAHYAFNWQGQRLLNNRSEEHTSELQSRLHLVCRLLLDNTTC